MLEKENGHTNCKMQCMYDASNREIKEKAGNYQRPRGMKEDYTGRQGS
jgi:hypothetical protein